MIPEIILIVGLTIGIIKEYKNIKFDKISLSFLVLFFLSLKSYLFIETMSFRF